MITARGTASSSLGAAAVFVSISPSSPVPPKPAQTAASASAASAPVLSDLMRGCRAKHTRNVSSPAPMRITGVRAAISMSLKICLAFARADMVSSFMASNAPRGTSCCRSP